MATPTAAEQEHHDLMESIRRSDIQQSETGLAKVELTFDVAESIFSFMEHFLSGCFDQANLFNGLSTVATALEYANFVKLVSDAVRGLYRMTERMDAEASELLTYQYGAAFRDNALSPRDLRGPTPTYDMTELHGPTPTYSPADLYPIPPYPATDPDTHQAGAAGVRLALYDSARINCLRAMRTAQSVLLVEMEKAHRANGADIEFIATVLWRAQQAVRIAMHNIEEEVGRVQSTALAVVQGQWNDAATGEARLFEDVRRVMQGVGAYATEG